MDFFYENKKNAENSQGRVAMGGRKFGVENRQIRRPLVVLNQNIVGGVQQNASGVNKRSLEQNFAAQIANSKAQSPQEIKKHMVLENNISMWEDSPITDVEEHEEAKDQSVPMSLEKRKEVSYENDRMEVEMEDILQEPVVDVDIGDAKNPLAAADYVEDLYAYYRNMEGASRISPNYMAHQFDINAKMRAILIDWLIEVNYKFELRGETLFLTVNLIDRFLEKQCVERKNLQLVGLVAMLLACKYEEVSVPLLDDLVFISDKAYTRKEILEMETLMLNTLQFNMSVPTAYVFMTRYLKAAQSDKKMIEEYIRNYGELCNFYIPMFQLELLSYFLIELCLVEYEMLKFPPSFLASAAIYTAQCTLHGTGQWNKTCEWHTKYSKDQLLECSRMIANFHQKAATGKLTAVHRKYSTSKFGFAS